MISSRRSGFTLIEILIVVGIIGLLVTVLLAVLLAVAGKGPEHQAKDFVNNRLPAAMTKWQQESMMGSNDYPNSPNMRDGADYRDGNINLFDELVTKPQKGGKPAYIEDGAYIKGDHQGKPIFLDPWNNPYIYRNYTQKLSKSGSGVRTSIGKKYSEDYDIVSCGPDGIYGNDDDIARGK
ncbi:MAG: prepilin-type N-terminal cleavage/methylation domain-containing protein [Planctomycetes bacterium]|nr:prepilin-type N-terminal cleavage/methylation domain-containing protein [Planctomycetota bacterium]MCW8135196.1 prepilin-type N-terminal cleavage/methylation domain-containing protein [Planctomycetota bacterium]